MKRWLSVWKKHPTFGQQLVLAVRLTDNRRQRNFARDRRKALKEERAMA